jgi:hypothetical protein
MTDTQPGVVEFPFRRPGQPFPPPEYADYRRQGDRTSRQLVTRPPWLHWRILNRTLVSGRDCAGKWLTLGISMAAQPEDWSEGVPDRGRAQTVQRSDEAPKGRSSSTHEPAHMSQEDKLRDYLRRATADLSASRQRPQELEAAAREPIAIVAISCRYPGGVSSQEDLWAMLVNGADGISPGPDDDVQGFQLTGNATSVLSGRLAYFFGTVGTASFPPPCTSMPPPRTSTGRRGTARLATEPTPGPERGRPGARASPRSGSAAPTPTRSSSRPRPNPSFPPCLRSGGLRSRGRCHGWSPAGDVRP